MQIVVLMKPVPDPAAASERLRPDGRLDRSSGPAVVNPNDEYAIEAAALCNPSVVPHPDQGGLEPGELRVAVSLRGIGEGHISCLEFTTAVVTGSDWRFNPREGAPVAGHVSSAAIDRD